MEFTYEVEYPQDLELLLYPSFALPLFDVGSGVALKRYGVCSGLIVRVARGGYIVSHEDPFCIEYSRFILGLWFNPLSHVPSVSRRFTSLVKALLQLYPGFTLSISPLDDVAVFTSIILSRRTDYHVNTVKWVRALLELYGDIARVTGVDPGELASRVSRSFQVTGLPRILSCYLSGRGSYLSSSLNARGLLACGGVGPKVLYSYILHVLGDTSYAPVDVNLSVFLENTGFGGYLRVKPVKSMCYRYDCDKCPLRSSCVESILRRELGALTGWFQTVAYIHVKRYCRRGACSKCSLRDLCTRSSREVPLSDQQLSRV